MSDERVPLPAKIVRPSIEDVIEASRDSQGFCLACGEIADCCEPDARCYKCEACGERQVYGAEEIALMGLTS